MHMSRNPLSGALFPLVCAALVACGGDAPPANAGAAGAAESAPPATQDGGSPSLDAALSLGVMNARQPVPDLLTAGQITQEQLDGLRKAGWTRFISLRLPSEQGTGWEESYAAEHGISFTRLPIDGSGSLTRENVEALDRLLRDDKEGTVLYCSSSNRVGAMLALRSAWVDGAAPMEALAFGRSAGMTRLEPAVAKLLGVAAGS